MKYINSFYKLNENENNASFIESEIREIFKDTDFSVNVYARASSFGPRSTVEFSKDNTLRVNVEIFSKSNAMVRSGGIGDIIKFGIEDIMDNLLILSKLGYDYNYQGLIGYDGTLRLSNPVDDLYDILEISESNNIIKLDVGFTYDLNLKCSNPECDNILVSKGEKCKICGE